MTTIADVVLARLTQKARYKKGSPEEELLFASFCLENQHLTYSQRLQDLWVLYETDKVTSGYFVDFGAGNGRDSSNSFILHRKFGWKGILVEPNADYLDNLNFHASPGVEVKTGLCVVGDPAVTEVDFVVSSDPSISTLHYTVDTDGHGGLRRHLPSETRKLPAITLKNLVRDIFMDKFTGNMNIGLIDYLSIDTEGSEYDILHDYFMAGDRRYCPIPIKLITVEHNYNETNRNLIFDMLTKCGYIRRFTDYSGHDDFYIHKNGMGYDV